MPERLVSATYRLSVALVESVAVRASLESIPTETRVTPTGVKVFLVAEEAL